MNLLPGEDGRPDQCNVYEPSEEQVFTNPEITGSGNEFRDNGKGDLCPPDYPWPQEAVTFSSEQLDFGSGLLVVTEQCNDQGFCAPQTEKVGLPIEKSLTVKNEGTTAVTLTYTVDSVHTGILKKEVALHDNSN